MRIKEWKKPRRRREYGAPECESCLGSGVDPIPVKELM
jgi:hypothetical protein